MPKLEILNDKRVFHYFEEISSIHRGSGDMEAISRYCIAFADAHSLKHYTDDNKNVVIYKKGTKGLENSQPVIFSAAIR